MWPDRVSNPGPLTYESGALPTALRGPACGSVAQMWFGSSVEFSHGKQEALGLKSRSNHDFSLPYDNWWLSVGSRVG